MPRTSKGARLYWRKPRRDASGAVIEAGRWVIRDGSRTVGTGCGLGEGEEAERKLQAYIANKYAPPRRERALSQVRINDVISVYLDDVAPSLARPGIVAGQCERLSAFFGSRTLADITGALCRAYVDDRAGKGNSNKGKGGGARRDLQTLAAAINHHHREGLHREAVRVVLPPRGKARQRWLTRDEAARLLWVCWRTREAQEGVETKKHPLRHLCRFLLIGLYTGSRPGAIFNASWREGRGFSYVDVDRNIFHRHAGGATETAKRQPSVKIPARLAVHLARWKRVDAAKRPQPAFVVSFAGAQIKSAKTGLAKACHLAGLENVTGYTLRHTCASWLVSKGLPTRLVADFLGTSEQMILQHYGHLAPDYQDKAAKAIGGK